VSRGRFGFLVIVTLVGSTIGGALSWWWLAPSPVKAQKINGVNAEEFLLLDTSGKARAGLGLDKNGEVGLVLMSRDGNRTLALSPDDRFAVKLSDQSGRVLWSAP
jgi:Zn-dependent protease